MRAYHGTNQRFDAFDANYHGAATSGAGTDIAFFFATDPDTANIFARNAVDSRGEGEPIVIECEINVGEMLEIDCSDGVDLDEALGDAHAEGYDTVILRNVRDGVEDDVTIADHIAVFDDCYIHIIG